MDQPIASSSYVTIVDSCETQFISSYPISDLRSSPLQRPRIALPPTVASQPPPSLLSNTNSFDDKLYSKYSIPIWREIEPGVWSDGIDRVLSAAYPAVQDFLATARRTLSLPLPPSEVIFVIAALEVFYAWNDPVHWMFWSDEKKNSTAAVVNRIALRKPQLIRSKVSWNGEAEYLFILSGLHGSSSLPVDKDWFHILNPAKAPTAPMNLRKRKPQQTEQIETPGVEDGSEIEEPRPKRPKTRSARLVKPANPVNLDNIKPPTTDSAPSDVYPAKSTIISISPQDNGTPLDTNSTPATQPKPSRETPDAREELSAPDPLPILRAGTVSFGSAVDPHIPAPSYTRNRSISQTSSQTTFIADERRSTSVSSNHTVVEAHAVNDKAMKDDQPMSDSEEEKEGMVTRGRANKGRTSVVQGKDTNRPTRTRTKRRSAK
ncbi:hypothetical protein C0995_007440 [Termitomyces sp. Mi166|nr:hypothetical protein C0995_007440 [Termitomyces sp. Mi166\